MNEVNINALLEQESQNNKSETWNKLNRTIKIQKLHTFSEKFCKDNDISIKDAKLLKQFFNQCLEDNKLQKTKDVQYNKDTGEISSVPSLVYNKMTKKFALKVNDKKITHKIPKKKEKQEEQEKPVIY